jgi:hypothetical protein
LSTRAAIRDFHMVPSTLPGGDSFRFEFIGTA